MISPLTTRLFSGELDCKKILIPVVVCSGKYVKLNDPGTGAERLKVIELQLDQVAVAVLPVLTVDMIARFSGVGLNMK